MAAVIHIPFHMIVLKINTLSDLQPTVEYEVHTDADIFISFFVSDSSNFFKCWVSNPGPQQC
jgi:hypothetical protein